MLTVVGSLKTRTLRVLWLLEEMGEPYESQPSPPRSEEAKAANASGKVPVLIDDGHKIADSTAILTYLADKYQKFTFPAGTPERALQDGFTNFALDEFDACLWTAARHSFILPEEMRVPAVKDSLRWEFERSQKIFCDRVGDGPFVMGDTMTIADIIAAHCGRWARNANFPISDPRFGDYIERLLNRPALQRLLAD